jgi:hypothetical protein
MKMKKSAVPSGLRFAKTLAFETCERDSGRVDVRESSTRKTPRGLNQRCRPRKASQALTVFLRHGSGPEQKCANQ